MIVGVATMVSERFLVATAPAASVRVTATVEVPAAVGVPEITPVPALIDKPAGRLVADQFSGAVPPELARVVLYATPVFPLGNGDAVVIDGAALIVTVYCRVAAVSPRVSFSVIVAVGAPVAVGVPLITPVPALIVRPAGSPEADQM